MAAYQYEIDLVPHGGAKLHDDGSVNAKASWLGYAMPANELAERIDPIIPRARPWDDHMCRWGEEASNDVQLWFDLNRVESLTVRIDCAHPNAYFMSQIVRITEALNLSAVTPDTRLVLPSPNVFQIASHARASDAARLSLDPRIKDMAAATRVLAEARNRERDWQTVWNWARDRTRE